MRLYSHYIYIRQLLRPIFTLSDTTSPCFLHKTSLFWNIDSFGLQYQISVSHIFPLSTFLCAGIIMTEHPHASNSLFDGGENAKKRKQ